MFKIQKIIMEKQLGYLKSKDKVNNDTQNNMEKTITILIKVMNMVFIIDKIKRNVNIDLPQ
jgi:hypothetical protein